MTTAFFLCLSSIISADLTDSKPPSNLVTFFSPPAKYKDDYGKYTSQLKFYSGRPVKTKEDWQRRRKEILARWHNLMGDWPPLLKRPAFKSLKTTPFRTVIQHHIELETAPKRKTQDAYLLIPKGDGPFPAVVVVFYDAKTGIGEGRPFRDYAIQLARRGFVTLSLGGAPATYYPSKEKLQTQALSFHAYEAANCHTFLSQHPKVDKTRIGIVGHSYGGKWAMFAACLYEKFTATAWSDPGIVFDEKRPSVNYWDPWYLGFEQGKMRKRGLPSKANPRIGPYKTLVEKGHDLHELHALMAPRPFLVSGGSEDQPHRWQALNRTVEVNRFLGFNNRVAMTNRKGHSPTKDANEVVYRFFDHFLKKRK